MFETSGAQTRRRALPLLFLPVSVGFHAAIAIAALIASVWDVAFPSHSPMLAVAFQIAQSPPPPPPPPPPPAARTAPVTSGRPVVRPAEIVAPTIIPETIPLVLPEAPPAPVLPSSDFNGGEPSGVEGGETGGVGGGETGGVEGGVIGGVVTEEKPSDGIVMDGRVHIARDIPLPSDMRVVSKPYPDYPARAIIRSMEDQLIVRYVIGKNGRVRDVMVIQPPQHAMFVKPTLAAIRTWRFTALVRDGKAQEVVHELTVYFKLHRDDVPPTTAR